MVITVEHKHSQELALAKVKLALYEAGRQYGKTIDDVQEEWNENVGTCTFRVKGFRVKAKVTVDSEKVCLEGKIPMLLVGFTSKIESILHENMTRVLA
jgi:hypothetical protein